MAYVSAPPIGRRRPCAPPSPGWPIAPGSIRARDAGRESARRSRRARSPNSAAPVGPPAAPIDRNTTAETPWPQRESHAPGAGERSSGCHKSPATRPSRAAVRSVLTCTPISSASMGSGRSAYSSRCLASARARASNFGGVARRPASHVRHDSGDTPSIAANAACDFPSAIRHSRSVRGSTTSHPAINAGRRGSTGVARGVLQSANLWGRPVTLFAAHSPRSADVGTIGVFSREMARPAGFEPATPGLEGRKCC